MAQAHQLGRLGRGCNLCLQAWPEGLPLALRKKKKRNTLTLWQMGACRHGLRGSRTAQGAGALKALPW